MKKNKKSGIILITTLFFMAIAFMLAVVIAKNGKETLMGGNRYADSEQAYLAAVSGLEFIKGQLYRDRAWGTYKNNQLQIQPSSTSSDNTSQTIIIKENSDNNGLIGYILLDTSRGQVSENNYDSKFEIFFKNNPTNKEYACINNIDNDSNIIKVKIDNEELSNIQTIQKEESGITSQNTTEDTSKNKRDVPAKSFYAYVKGTCGKTVRYAEAIFVSNGPKSLDGGSIINGEVNINSYATTSDNNIISYEEDYNSDNPFITINNKSADKNGKITSANSLKIDGIGKNGTINDPAYLLNAKNKTIISSKGIEVGNFQHSSQNLPDSKDTPSHITYDPNPKISDKIKSLSDVDIASRDSTNNNSTGTSNNDTSNEYETIDSGTYVFINDIDNPKKSTWAYTSDIITEDTKNTEISTANFKKIKNKNFRNIEFVKKENTENNSAEESRTVNITGKVESNGNLSFIVVDKKNPNGKDSNIYNDDSSESYTADANCKYTQSSENTVDFSIKENGEIKTKANSGNANLFIEGEVTGSGKIYCDGNLTMNSGSTLETQANSGVAVWAKGNVNIKEAKNLTSNSESLQNSIIKDGIEEAKNAFSDINENTEININGQNITVDSEAQKTEADSVQTVKFKSEKDNIIRYEGPPWNRKAIYGNPKKIETNYKIQIKGDTISIYKNDKSIFNKTADQLKHEIYDYYYNKDFNGNYLNNSEEENTEAWSWYTLEKKYNNNIYLIDYSNNDWFWKDHSSNTDGHIGDMLLYIDDQSIGIIDINKSKISANENGTNIKSDSILFSTHDYRNKDNTNKNTWENKFENIQKPSSETEKPIDEELKQKSNTMEEYVVNYYKKQIANTEVKGTIYSKEGNININGSGGEFNITGALITVNGSLNINGVTHATLTYDPDYVPFFNDEGIFTRSLFESVF